MESTTKSADGVELWFDVEGTGDALILIPGRGDSSDLFPRLFTDPLVAAGYRVIRFDPRDTGLSGDGGDTYTLSTMADDVVAVLDAAQVTEAHPVAVSMGGMITVDLAARHASRIRSPVLIAAMSPDPDAGIGPDFFASFDGRETIDLILTAMGGPSVEDRRWTERELELAARRAPQRPRAGEQHQAASFRLGWPELGRLAEIRTPALVIHGTEDRLLPTAHAKAFANGIPNSELHIIDGMGHLPKPGEWESIAKLTLAHLGLLQPPVH